MSHQTFMHRCLELAENGRGKTGVNPMVGAVLVRDGTVLAEAWHSGYGNAHAERELAEKLVQKINSKDILYVNLEPCCHHGKTPPCTDIIIEKGIKTVVYGMQDPNPAIAGKGIAALQKAGVTVIGPIDPVSCRRLNRGFVSLQEQHRPWFTLKRAQTTAGAIAHEDGSRKQITSKEQDAWSHEWLRARHDAILVGVQTVVADDPQLNVRSGNSVSPLRIILDPHGRIPHEAKVVTDSQNMNTIIVHSLDDTTALNDLKERGNRLVYIPMMETSFDLQALSKFLVTPTEGWNGITSVLVEGGATTWRTFKAAGLVDEEVTLIGD